MPWLLLIGVAALAVYAFSKKGLPGLVIPDALIPAPSGGVELTVFELSPPSFAAGTWGYGVTDGSGATLKTDGPFASEAAARSAGLLWMAANPQPQDVPPPPPPPPQQGDGAPALPYLVVTSGNLTANVFAQTDAIRWFLYGANGGAQTGETANAATANAVVMERVNSNAPPDAGVTIALRRANGTTAKAVVSKTLDGVIDVWRWSVSTTSPPSASGVFVTEALWVAASRFAAMQKALTTLQGL